MTLQRTLGLRLSVWYASLFVISTLVLVVLTYALLDSSLVQRDHDIIRATVREYASRYELGGLLALQRAVELEERTGDEERLFVRVIGPGADALFARMPQGWSGYAQEELGDTRRGLAEGATHDGRAILEVASVTLGDGTILQVGKSNEIRLGLLRKFQWIVGLVSLIALGIGVTGGLVLTRSTVQPIYDLIGVVRDIIRTGRTDTRVPERSASGDAVDELSALFNTMLDRINGLIAAMGQSLDHVAHDLRTPLARLRGVAERALQTADPAEAREALATCLEESERILSMLNTLMDISEAETGVVQLQREPVNLGGLLGEVVELYEDVAEAKHITVTLEPAIASRESAPGVPHDGSDDVTISGARNRLRQVFANLLDNAIKYTPDGGRVSVTVGREGDRAVVTVSDTGVGIGPEHLPRIWERLYRADASRSERGLGLGLSLVQAYVAAHGGTVAATSTPGGGSVFTVRLPIEPDRLPILSPM